MSISTELSRIQANRNTIRAKLVELGMATSTDKLDALASAIESIVNRGAVLWYCSICRMSWLDITLWRCRKWNTSSSGTARATQKLKLEKITIEQIPEKYREDVKKN